MSFLASKRVRAATGVAMLVAGAPAVRGVWEAFQPSLIGPRLGLALLVVAWGSGWAVLAAWAWRSARAAQGWRRIAGLFIAAFPALAALASLTFLVFYGVSEIRSGYPLTLEWVELLCPGLLVGGVWVLAGLHPGRLAPSAHSEG